MPAPTLPYAATSGNAAGGASSTITVTSPGTIGTEDIVLVSIGIRGDRTVTGSEVGWTSVSVIESPSGTNAASGMRLYQYWRRGTPGSWTFSLSASTGGWNWGCTVIRGAHASNAPTFSTGRAENASATVEMPALTGLTAESLIIATGAATDTVAPQVSDWGAEPTGSGYTQIVESFSNVDYSLMMAVKTLGAAETSLAEYAWTLNAGPQNTASRTAAFAPAPAAASTMKSGWGIIS